MRRESQDLRPLVDHLAQALQADEKYESGRKQVEQLPVKPAARQSDWSRQDSSFQCRDTWQWQDWTIVRIDGGMNNRLFRATGPNGDVAVKFTTRDTRDRAGREWAALEFLAENSADLAPLTLLLDRDRYAHQVIVQTWLAGESSASIPVGDAAWNSLSQHLLTIHSLPKSPDHPAIRPVVLFVTSPAEALQAIRLQHSRLQRAEWPDAVNDLTAQVLSIRWPRWPQPSLRFCRSDPNIRNFVRRANAWASVDWEYSGWGDPAFEIADFLVHAAHSEWPRQQTRRLANIYGECSNDTAIRERIAVYETLMLVWWTLRLGRILPEARSGRDKRLVTFSQSWLLDRQRLQKRYQNLAEAALANWKAVL